ncbi:ran GTPase-activating protein 1-like [Morone saxatilis]|uniref:ran GTPase-activating protein 1-like n=1 Tax=Morone saxatilis TaxID=34816 RepID=UPI0015E24572|nr:ran GTPase-activating protein 1-like [Morone saxatilis]
MAAVSAELKFRDGMRQKICVKVENNLSSLINGVHELNENVSRLLSELVEREKARGDCADGEDEDEEGSDDDDDDDEEEEEEPEPEVPQNSKPEPPAKRSKT